ncbi:MAG: hypothetical protein GXO19_01590 [Epsilonproteobacteria bacterium]|nr:hypothetical protein [Campylobacterota bacterium]NPA56408.1 hypothetical protein [Campylobacterota bacterium]
MSLLHKATLLLSLFSLPLLSGGKENIHTYIDRIDQMILEEVNITALPQERNGTTSPKEEDNCSSEKRVSTERETPSPSSPPPSQLPSIAELKVHFQGRERSSPPPKTLRRGKGRERRVERAPEVEASPSGGEGNYRFIASFVGEGGKRVALTEDGELLREREEYRGCLVEEISLLKVELRCGKRRYIVKVGE